MKKTILLSLSPFLFGAIAVQAQTSTESSSTPTAVTTPAVTDERTPVKTEDLPEAVKQTLATDEYKGWETGNIFWVSGEKAAYYEINMKQADKVLVVKLDKEGKKVD